MCAIGSGIWESAVFSEYRNGNLLRSRVYIFNKLYLQRGVPIKVRV
jgi:hypothetical protein